MSHPFFLSRALWKSLFPFSIPFKFWILGLFCNYNLTSRVWKNPLLQRQIKGNFLLKFKTFHFIFTKLRSSRSHVPFAETIHFQVILMISLKLIIWKVNCPGKLNCTDRLIWNETSPWWTRFAIHALLSKTAGVFMQRGKTWNCWKAEGELLIK